MIDICIIIWIFLQREISKSRKVGIRSRLREPQNHAKKKDKSPRTTLYSMQARTSSTNPPLIYSMMKFPKESWKILQPKWPHFLQANQRKRVTRKKHQNFPQNKGRPTHQYLIMKEIYSLQWQPDSRQSKWHAKTNVNR